MSGIHNLLSSCSSINALDVRVSLQGCSNWPDRWSFPLDPAGSSSYPSKIETLALEGYRFDDSDWKDAGIRKTWDLSAISYWLGSVRAWKWLKWSLTLSSEQKAKVNIDLWLDAMDFSHIHTLQIKGFKGPPNVLASRMPAHLPSLRSLTVTGTAIRDFVMALPPSSLEHVSWKLPSTHNISIINFLQHHGQRLRSLEWRSKEALTKRFPALSAPELRQLKTLAPGLQSLTLDLNRNGSWPWEHLDAMAEGLPTGVNKLTLYLAMAGDCWKQDANYNPYSHHYPDECEITGPFESPVLTTDDATKLFQYLRAKKTGEPLAEMELFAGDWSRPWDGPLYLSDWLEARKAWAKCRVRKDHSGVHCEGEDTNLNWRGRGHYIPKARKAAPDTSSDLQSTPSPVAVENLIPAEL